MAVLSDPDVLKLKDRDPVAVFRNPSVLYLRDRKPVAVFSVPVVLEFRAVTPNAVLETLLPAPRPTVSPLTDTSVAELVTPATVAQVSEVASPPVDPKEAAFRLYKFPEASDRDDGVRSRACGQARNFSGTIYI